MGENYSGREDTTPKTGVNDHAWEREHSHPAAGQAKAIGYRRRDAEMKLEQHLRNARQSADEESEGQQK